MSVPSNVNAFVSKDSDGHVIDSAHPGFDAGPAQVMSFGVAGATLTSANASAAPIVCTSIPIVGQKLVITDVEISTDTALNLTFTEENTGTIVGKYFLPANSYIQVTPRGKKKLSGANNRLMVQSNIAGNIAITPHYYSEA